jgi:hypothetical protein
LRQPLSSQIKLAPSAYFCPECALALPSLAAFEAAHSGWCNAGRNLVLAKSSPLAPLGPAKTFSFRLEPIPAAASMYFVCQRGATQPGSSIYVVGTLHSLGDNDPSQAVRLQPSVYYPYVVDGFANDPRVPIWTVVIPELPPNTDFDSRFLRKREDGNGTVDNGKILHARTGSSGYSGSVEGSL